MKSFREYVLDEQVETLMETPLENIAQGNHTPQDIKKTLLNSKVRIKDDNGKEVTFKGNSSNIDKNYEELLNYSKTSKSNGKYIHTLKPDNKKKLLPSFNSEDIVFV